MTTPAAVATPTDAPPAFVPFIIYMRCTENRVEDDYDGGMLLMQGVKSQRPVIVAELNDSRLVLSAVHDDFMRQFPVTRDEKQSRFFRVTVEEVPYADLPPDPDAAPELFNRAGQRVDQHGNLIG